MILGCTWWVQRPLFSYVLLRLGCIGYDSYTYWWHQVTNRFCNYHIIQFMGILSFMVYFLHAILVLSSFVAWSTIGLILINWSYLQWDHHPLLPCSIWCNVPDFTTWKYIFLFSFFIFNHYYNMILMCKFIYEF